MDQLPYDNTEELIQLFHGLVTSNQNEEKLVKMMQQPLRLIEALVKILMNEKSDEESSRSKREAINVVAFLSRNLNTIPVEELEKIVDHLTKCLALHVRDPSIARNIQIIIQSFCSLNGEFLMKAFFQAAKRMESSILEDIFFSILLLESLASSPFLSVEIFEQLYPNLVSSSSVLMTNILNEQTKMQGEAEIGEEILKKLAETWTFILKSFIEKIFGSGSPRKKTLKRLERDFNARQDIPNILIRILRLQVPPQLSPFYQGLVPIISKGKKLSQILNKTKEYALECFSLAIESLVEQKGSDPSETKKNMYFFFIQSYGLQIILPSLHALCKLKFSVLEEYLQDEYLCGCLSKSLKVLIQLVPLTKPNNIFLEARNILIMDICIPLIFSTKQDMELLQRFPHEYLAIMPIDEIDREDVKSRALSLISELCDYVDGSLSFAVANMLAVINFSLNSNEGDQIPAQYPTLVNFKESTFLTQIPPNRRVETCLLVLKCLAANVSVRPDLLQLVENSFISYKDFYLGEQCDNLIRARICQVMEDYLQLVFHNNHLAFEDYLNLLVEFAGIEAGADPQDKPEQFLISSLAIKAFDEVLLLDESLAKITPYINQIFGRFVTYMEFHTNLTFFEFISELITLYRTTITQDTDLVLRFVESITLRIQTELAAALSGKPSKHLINKMWAILIAIVKIKEFLPFQDEIDKHLTPVFMAVVEADFDLEEDILDYVNNQIQIKKEVSPLCLKLFKQLPNIYRKLSNSLPSIFPTSYQIIAYGKDLTNNSSECVDWFLYIAVDNIQSNNDSLVVCLSALLLQVVIQNVKIKEDKQWEELLKTCYEKFQESQGRSKDFEMAKLIGVFLVAFQQDFERTQSCFAKVRKLEYVMELIINQAIAFHSHSYDRKLLASTLSSFLLQEKMEAVVKDKLPKILELIICLLTFIKHLENFNSHKKAKIFEDDEDDDDMCFGREKGSKALLKQILNGSIANKGNTNDEEEDYEDDNDDEEAEEDDDEVSDKYNMLQQEDKVNHYLSSWVTSLDQKDEFKIFRETIIKLKAKDRELFKRMSENLSEAHRQYMRDILKTQKVVVNEEKQEVKTRRILKVIKRKDRKKVI